MVKGLNLTLILAITLAVILFFCPIDEKYFGSLATLIGVVAAGFYIKTQIKEDKKNGKLLLDLSNKRETYVRILSPTYGEEISSLILDAPLIRIEEYCKLHFVFKDPCHGELDNSLVDIIHISMALQLEGQLSHFNIANNYRSDLLKSEEIPHYLLMKLVLLSPNISQRKHQWVADVITDLSKKSNISNINSRAVSRAHVGIINKYNPSKDLLNFLAEIDLVPIVEAMYNTWIYAHMFPDTEYFNSYWKHYSEEFILALRNLQKHLNDFSQEKYGNMIMELSNVCFNIGRASMIDSWTNMIVKNGITLPNVQ